MSWLAWALVSLVTYGLWAVVIKYANAKMDPYSVTFFNGIVYVVLTIAVIAFLWFSKTTSFQVNSPGIWLAILAGAIATVAVLAEIVALKTGKLAIVGPMVPLGVAVITILGGLLLFKEVLTLKSGVGLALALAAIYLLSAG